MSDFSDRPFVAGSLIGLRAFSVDNLGRLMGPLYPQVFTPGENVAECRKREDSWSALHRAMQDALNASMWTIPPAPPSPPPSLSRRARRALGASDPTPTPDVAPLNRPALSEAAVEKPTPEHTLAGLDCACGFYAYFDGGTDYKEHGRVHALIEGYGVCTVGDRGFRASKARLVAIVRSERINERRMARLERNYPDVPFYSKRREAMEAHPLSEALLPQPTDDDFWTRQAKP